MFSHRAIGDDQIGGMCHIVTALLKDLIITVELAEFISGLKPKYYEYYEFGQLRYSGLSEVHMTSGTPAG